MAANPALGSAATMTMVGNDIRAITPDDDEDLPVAARAIRCKPASGAAGTLRVTTLSGAVRDTEIGQGEVLVVGAKRVHAAGTTASGLEAII